MLFYLFFLLFRRPPTFTPFPYTTLFRSVGGRDSRESFAIGGAAEVLEKIRAFADAGLPKLILRPLASNDEDTIKQTQLMIDEIQPEIAAMNPADKAAHAAAANC